MSRGATDDRLDPLRVDLEARIDGYRERGESIVADLDEDEARSEPVDGLPSLLGLLRHLGFVEGVWFDEAVTGRSWKEIGIPSSMPASLRVRTRDTIESVTAEHRRIVERSRELLDGRALDEIVTGRGERRIGELLIHVHGELAWRGAQADVVRHALRPDEKRKA